MAATARKDPQRAERSNSSTRAQSPLPPWLFDDGGFTAFPRGFFREACKRLTPAGRDVLGLVYEETIGTAADPDPREATDLSIEQIAEILNVSKRCVADAFVEIAPLIERKEKKGVGCYTSIKPHLFSNLCSIPERAPRKKKPAAEKAAVKEQELAALAEDIRQLAKSTIECVLEIGGKLCQAKDLVGHGKWEAWLKDEFGWGKSTAERYMNVFHRFGEGKSVTVTDLSIDLAALYLLASRNTKSETVTEIVDRARSGEHITKAAVREAVKKQDPCTPLLGLNDHPCTGVHGSEPTRPGPVLVSPPEAPAAPLGTDTAEASDAVITGQPANFCAAGSREELRRAIGPLVLEKVGKTIDDSMCDRVIEALSGAPVQELVPVLSATPASRFKNRSLGLLPHLAMETRDAYRERCRIAIEASMCNRSSAIDAQQQAQADVERLKWLLCDPFLFDEERQQIVASHPELASFVPSDDQVREYLRPHVSRNLQLASGPKPKTTADIIQVRQAREYLDQVRERFPDMVPAR